MTNYKTPSELGLSDEDLLDVVKSMVYWEQFPPEEFIMIIVSHIKETIAGASMWTLLLSKNPEKASMKIIDTDSAQMTLSDACNAIENNQARAIQFLEISSQYARELKNKDKF